MRKRARKLKAFSDQSLREEAKSDPELAGLLALKDANLDFPRSASAYMLIASLKALKMIIARGVPFEAITPMVIVRAIQNPEATARELLDDTQPALPADAAAPRG